MKSALQKNPFFTTGKDYFLTADFLKPVNLKTIKE